MFVVLKSFPGICFEFLFVESNISNRNQTYDFLRFDGLIFVFWQPMYRS